MSIYFRFIIYIHIYISFIYIHIVYLFHCPNDNCAVEKSHKSENCYCKIQIGVVEHRYHLYLKACQWWLNVQAWEQEFSLRIMRELITLLRSDFCLAPNSRDSVLLGVGEMWSSACWTRIVGDSGGGDPSRLHSKKHGWHRGSLPWVSHLESFWNILMPGPDSNPIKEESLA